ncbi:ac17 [Sucra jujuba nucleopolyhedrovirus]|uniref:Ac17 n=1 Tax=Sucra jujuba nucleopolyhedrovirus TaxID=1563660 RepID=A0A097P950_9ABAC|nr:ac17 [Sucra jujuba nucleopolyhedrovirus]AIU41356.1 ac17 [Sucra jujuba nucleopolyhedrovirus]
MRSMNNSVSVYVDNEKIEPINVKLDAQKNVCAQEYCLNIAKHSSKPVRIEVDSNGKFIQSTFICPPKYICIVNASDKHKPCVFDGFLNDDDESQTKKFCVPTLNTLKSTLNLGVLDMVRIMEKPTVIKVFVNEAISSSNCCNRNKWYKRFWFKDDDDDDEKQTLLAKEENFLEHENYLLSRIFQVLSNDDDGDDTANYIDYDNLPSRKINLSNWADVECCTGKLLLELDLLFNYEYK